MTLPFVCEDCRGPITLTTDEALAIYEARIALCQGCIDHMRGETAHYNEIMRDEGYECAWDDARRAFVVRQSGGA